MALAIVRDQSTKYNPMYRIECDDLESEAGLSGALDDLTIAFDRYLVEREVNAYSEFAIEFYTGGSLFIGDHEPQHGPYDEHYDSVRAFWYAVLKRPTLDSKMHAWLDRMSSVLIGTPNYDSIFETEEYQLGELLVSILALSDRKRIPIYTKFLALWFLDHEVHQSDEIAKIFKRHGVCKETEELLYCRTVTNIGQNGHDDLDALFPILQAHYGDFTQTLLFRSIVKDRYDRNLAWFEEATARGEKASLSRALMTYNPVIRAAADAIVAQLRPEQG